MKQVRSSLFLTRRFTVVDIGKICMQVYFSFFLIRQRKQKMEAITIGKEFIMIIFKRIFLLVTKIYTYPADVHTCNFRKPYFYFFFRIFVFQPCRIRVSTRSNFLQHFQQAIDWQTEHCVYPCTHNRKIEIEFFIREKKKR